MQTWNANESIGEMSSVVTAGGIKNYFLKIRILRKISAKYNYEINTHPGRAIFMTIFNFLLRGRFLFHDNSVRDLIIMDRNGFNCVQD